MPRRNRLPYWLDSALHMRRKGETLKEIAASLDVPLSTIRYQLAAHMSRNEYDSLCLDPNTSDGRARTEWILNLHSKGINGNQIAKQVGVSRQYVYKLLQLQKEQDDSHLDWIANKKVLEQEGKITKNYIYINK